MDEHQIICGECLKVLPTLAAGSVDLVVFSPPYDNLRDFKGFPPIDRVGLGSELFRVCKDGAVCAVVIQDQTSDGAKSLTSFRWAVEWADRCGWRLFETCIYRREGVPGGWWSSRFRVDHEYVHLFLKGDRPRHFDKSRLMVPTKYGGTVHKTGYRKKDGSVEKTDEFVGGYEKCRGTIWQYTASVSEGNVVKLQHPATHPDALYGDIIQCFSAPGDLVLDPMAGSGTTNVMAGILGRRSIGIECAAEYAAIARSRLYGEVEPQCF